MNSLRQTLSDATEILARQGVDSPRLCAELLAAHVLRLPRLQLALLPDRPLTADESARYEGLVRRRAAREPLQYILGSVSFCGLDLTVDARALIPRPETEELSGHAERLLAGPARALDWGTGSGCLAIYLALRRPAANVTAVDQSPAALALARQNAARHGVAQRIAFHCGDGFAALPDAEPFDLIVSNPPYIPTDELASLQPEVREHEPRAALDGGPDGLACFRRLAEAGGRLVPGGHLVVEFGDGQAKALQALFQDRGWRVCSVEKDLSGRERILIARRADC